MASTSKRQAAIAEIKARLSTIRVKNGFNTDAGASLFIEERPPFGPDDPPAAIVVAVGRDVVSFQGPKMFIEIPYQIQAVAPAVMPGEEESPTWEPWETIEALIADIKRAMEPTSGPGADHSLGGATGPQGLLRGETSTMERQAPTDPVGAGVDYRVRLEEGWGNP